MNWFSTASWPEYATASTTVPRGSTSESRPPRLPSWAPDSSSTMTSDPPAAIPRASSGVLRFVASSRCQPCSDDAAFAQPGELTGHALWSIVCAVIQMRLRRAVVLMAGGLMAVSLVLLAAAPGAPGAAPGWQFGKISTAANPTGRVYDAAATTADGRAAVYYGGDVPTGNGPDTGLASTWVYDPAGWHPKCGTTVAGATSPCGPGIRSALGMGTGPSGVILFGGFSTGFGNGPPDGDTWRWNGTTWSQVCATATCGLGARALPAMAGNGAQVVLYGGFEQTANSAAPAADTWIFNGTRWTQLCGAAPATPCGPGRRVGASLAWDGQHFVMFGGQSAVEDDTQPTADTWILNGRSWTRVCGAPAAACGPPARILGAFAYARGDGRPTGALLAEGGNLLSNGPQTLYRDAWFWDPAGRWSTLSAPWSGPPVTFGPNGSPPPGPDPLLGVAASLPTLCAVVYRASNVVSATPNLVLASNTFIASARTSTNANHCFVAPPPTPTPTPTPRPTVPAAHPPAAASPILPATGTRRVGALLATGVSLLGTGAMSLYLGRRRHVSR
jgi:hypothetical protein